MIYWMSLQQEKVKKKLNHYMKKKKQFQLRIKKNSNYKKNKALKKFRIAIKF